MSLKSAFNHILSKHQREGRLNRLSPAQDVPIFYSPSNLSRKLEGPSETTFEGREFIITKSNLVASGWTGPLKTADRIIDPELGYLTIDEIEEMYGDGATIIGFRVRTS